MDYIIAIMQLPEELQMTALELLDDLTYEFNKANYNQAEIDRIDNQLMAMLQQHGIA